MGCIRLCSEFCFDFTLGRFLLASWFMVVVVTVISKHFMSPFPPAKLHSELIHCLRLLPLEQLVAISYALIAISYILVATSSILVATSSSK